MKSLLIAAGMAFLLAGLAGRGEAQSDRVFFIPELTDAQVAAIDIEDGSIEDWQEMVGEPVLLGADLYAVVGDYDPASCAFRVWLGWHGETDRLYVAMEQVDDVYINEYTDSNMQAHDSNVVLYVDGDNSGGRFQFLSSDFPTEEEFLLANNQHAQVYTAIAEVRGDSPPIELQWTSYYDDWSVKPPYADAGGGSFGDAPTVAVTEFYVTPFDFLVWNSSEESLVSDLYAGKRIGLMMALSDFDVWSDDLWERMHPTAVFHLHQVSNDAFFVDAVLVGGGPSEDTAVEDVTWARIKASFR
jgi:hypothetical protein